jgi:endonuclease/exonuclease/phosphatase family metal-dependent hydrolase
MKKSHAWTLTILLTLVFTFQAGLALADSLTIATFNCEFLTRPKVHVKFGLSFNLKGAERQQWDQPGFRDQKFKEVAKAVAEVIHSINADVIALTEVGDETDVAELRSEVRALGLDYEHMAVCDSADNLTKQHVAVLSRFPLTDIKVIIPGRESYLEEPDDPETEDDTGISKGMRVTVLAHDREFILYVLHMASEKGGHEQDQQRISQASIVRRHYLPAIKDGKMVIVAGDLNEKRGQPTLHRIRGLHDIHEDLIQAGHKRYFDSDKLDTRWTYEFEGVRQQIDHILLSYSIKHACKRSGIKARTLSHNNPLVSDHRPLIVTLNLKD